MPEPESELEKKVQKTDNKPPKSAKRKLSNNNASRSKKTKPNLANEIDVSKTLKQRLQTTRKGTPAKRKSNKSNTTEVKYCGNGKPMPSLAELEKMFEDSDTEDEANGKQQNNATAITAVPTSTPLQEQPTPEVANLTSPKTIKKIASRILDMVTDLTEPPVLLDDDLPPPPIVKPKKIKKSGIPYIVGCKDRPYVPSKPNNNVFKGEEEYGVDENGGNDDDDDTPQKRAKRTTGGNISKSIFNAVADDIAAKLKKQDEDSDAKSDDSSKTVAYEYWTPPNSNRKVRSFSPLPSTSKDNETFIKNDQLFNESLISERETSATIDDDIEIIETPCETIVVKDCDNTLASNKSASVTDPTVVEIIDVSSVETPVDSTHLNTSNKNDDSVQLIDVKPASPISVEEYYSTITPDVVANDVDVCEVIDVDDVIAENAAIIKKYSNKNDLNTVISVDLSTPEPVVPKRRNISIIPVVPYTPYVPKTGPSPNKQPMTAPSPIKKPMTASEWAYSDMTPNRSEVVEMCEKNLREIQRLLIGSSDQDLLKNTLYSLEYLSKARAEEAKAASTSSQCQTIPDTNKAPSGGSSQDSGKGIGDCPICMDLLSNKTVASTMCGHLFCMNCIKLAIKSNGRKCPTCRKSLKGAGFHQIFL